jgi:hypothetical protein
MPPIQNTTSQRDSPRNQASQSFNDQSSLSSYLVHRPQSSALQVLPSLLPWMPSISSGPVPQHWTLSSAVCSLGYATPTTQQFRVNHPPFTISDLHILPLNHSMSAGSQVSAFVYLLLLRLSLSLSLSPFFILRTSLHVDCFVPAHIFCTILFSWRTRPTWWKKLRLASRCTTFKELESGHFITIEPMEDFPNWIEDHVNNTVSERSTLTGDFMRFNSKN